MGEAFEERVARQAAPIGDSQRFEHGKIGHDERHVVEDGICKNESACRCVLCQDDGEPLTQKIVRNLVALAARKALLANDGVHTLRHTFCSHLAMRGAPARAIQDLAGHKDLSTTQRYMHLSPAAIQAAIRLLETSASDHGRGDILETGEAEAATPGRWSA